MDKILIYHLFKNLLNFYLKFKKYLKLME